MIRRSARFGHKGRRRVAVWFAAFALSLQALVPLGQALPMPGGSGAYLVICTALGIQAIPDPNAPPKTDDRPICPVCMARALGAETIVAEPVALVPVSFSEVALTILPAADLPAGVAPPTPSTRDPPIV